MCRCKEAELNWVSKYTRRIPELIQLEMGMSTNRYLPARGTAGLARSLVSGNKRVPCPPPMITESTLLVLIDCRPVCDPITFGCSASLCILDGFIRLSVRIASSFRRIVWGSAQYDSLGLFTPVAFR